MREFRRLRALELFESGMKQVDVARALASRKERSANGSPYIWRKALMLFAIEKLQKSLADSLMSKK